MPPAHHPSRITDKGTRLLALSDVCRRPLTAHWAGDLVPGNPILDERSARFFDAVMMVLRILRRAHIDDDGTVVAGVVAQKDVQPARVEHVRGTGLSAIVSCGTMLSHTLYNSSGGGGGGKA
ncbi:hypothetical protein PPROV_000644800 [Pycnococcus provasolii]|uniref:Uncharacterized protein n=1 Tax=Pycnococcus provasolii TaxID=41880 RepID=A0A830HK06_9CHLO|nr:hypothetical protein PPROV_000644800 [Pycnococcus provasolii]